MRMLLLLLGLFFSVSAFAGEVELGDWYISKELATETWAGSVRAAKRSSKKWDNAGQWPFGKTRTFANKQNDLFAVAEVTADQDISIDFNTSNIKLIRLNGTVLKRNGWPYRLEFKKGKNILEIRIPLQKGARSAKSTLYQTNFKHALAPVAEMIESTRLAIEFLEDKHASYKARNYLKALAKLEDQNASAEEVDRLRYQALVLENPEVKFDEILFRGSRSAQFPANWQGNSTLLRSRGKETHPNFADSFEVLNLKDQSIKTIYRPDDIKEGLMDICLDFSGTNLLYSGIDTESNTFQVYEMNIDGTGKRQITPFLPEIDNYNGIY
ncbi:MAG: hypothetical protein OEL75_02660, partial [Kiritimatiellaceae bacterium]|nr:hypothetical protein [Kiritimatiellaceae bacterium]